MAFDGLTIKRIANELNRTLKGSRIKKIVQPQKEELLLTMNQGKETHRLLLSANASLPLIYLTNENRIAPAVAPNFCMVLRKHINGGLIDSITQIQNERVICMTVKHLNELGDPTLKHLYIEIMGKHSNLIFTDETDKIIDSIKHINALQSSVREVLPGRKYFIPFQEGKIDPYMADADTFSQMICGQNISLVGFFCSHYMGLSKVSANEIVYRAGLDGDASTDSLTNTDIDALYNAFEEVLYAVAFEREDCEIVMSDGIPKEYAPFRLSIYDDCKKSIDPSISVILSDYYKDRNDATRHRQRAGDVERMLVTLIDRTKKKLYLQEKQLADTQKADKFMLYGNLLTAYPHEVKPQTAEVTLEDYNTGNPIRIPLDKDLSAVENATRYFDKYNKLKRTKTAVLEQLEVSKEQLSHLESILTNLSLCDSDADLMMLKKELYEYGFTKKNPATKKRRDEKSKPLHFVTDDGFHIYVGKNNYQNDELTFKMATGNDWWFHAKQIPGSHVIVRTEGKELPDEVFEKAAQLAGYYSSGKTSEKLEIDYLEKKNVKRTPHTPPGFVIYYTNYSMTIHPMMPEGVTELT